MLVIRYPEITKKESTLRIRWGSISGRHGNDHAEHSDGSYSVDISAIAQACFASGQPSTPVDRHQRRDNICDERSQEAASHKLLCG
jgi:hypothetical protein